MIQKKEVRAEALQDYRDLLRFVKTDLNFLHQPESGEIEELESKKSKTVDKIYKNLFKELPKIPSFLGDVKTKSGGVYEKYFSSLKRLDVAFGILTKVANLVDVSNQVISPTVNDSQQRALRVLDSLLRLKRHSKSRLTGQIVEKVLINYGVSFQSLGQFDYFYRAPQARDKRGQKISITKDEKEVLESLPWLVKNIQVNWPDYLDVGQHLEQWLDFVELEKIKIGLLTYFYDCSKLYSLINDSQPLKDHFPQVAVILQRSPDKQSNQTINNIFQQAILAEMRGTIAKMTTSQIIVRYVVLPVESEKKLPLVTDFSEVGQARTNSQSYYIYNSQPEVGSEEMSDDLKLKKTKLVDKEISLNKKTKALKSLTVSANSLLRLNSSKYQLQFLDNAFLAKKMAKI